MTPRPAAGPGLLALALLALLAPATASAEPSATAAPAEPSATIDDDGVVVGTVTVSSSPEAALAKVNDPAWVAATGGEGTRVTTVSTEGACRLLDYVTEHPIATARYRVRQCKEPSGNRATLVESEAFSSYGTSWDVQPAGTGSQLVYRIDLISKLAVPKWIVRRTTRSSVQRLMEAIAKEL